MSRNVLLVLFFIGFVLTSPGELSKDDQKRLRDVEISGVRTSTTKDDDRNKIEALEINTCQNEDDNGGGFRIRIVAELTDAEKNRYIADFTGNRPGDLDSEYTGEDYWILYMPHGEMQRPKIAAYAVQYGFMDEQNFIVFAEKYKGVKTIEELTGAGLAPFPGTLRLKHYYMYEDGDSEEAESIAVTVREVGK